MDFNTVSISCLPLSTVLQGFIGEQFGYSIDENRDKIESAGQAAVAFSKFVLPPEKVPKQIGEWNVPEMLMPVTQRWSTFPEVFNRILQSLQTIGDTSIQRFSLTER